MQVGVAQQAYLKASNTGANDGFGFASAISGDTIVVGAYLEDSNAAGVNGNGADNSASSAGAVYVFVRSGTTWTQQAYLKASNPQAIDLFGYAVAISGDTIVVGAILEDSNATGVNGDQSNNSAVDSGAAYVFVRSGTTWTQQAYLKASNTGAGDEFGSAVAIAGDTIVVGADAEDSNAIGVNGNAADNSATDSGASYVFVRSGTTWNQQAYLKASNTDADDAFGISVGVAGETICVGAYFEDSNAIGVNGNQSSNAAVDAGAAYVFVRSGTAWSQQAYLKASNSDVGDNFGYAVAISNDTVAIGAFSEDSNAVGVNGNQNDNSAGDSGAAYVFVRSGTAWSQQAYLKASNTQAGDAFGASISIAGDVVVIAGLGEDSNDTGVNGNQANNSASSSGAVYVFVRSLATWVQQAYVKASNTGGGDDFGISVGISVGTAVVGAWNESSDATGVNGNQGSNSAASAGAAYVFQVPLPPPVAYCFGDGSDAVCPCANPGLGGRGCNNTVSSGGALLSSTGVASIAADTLILNGTFSVPFGPGLYYEGNTTANPSAPFGAVFGNGLRCAGGATNRLEVRFADGAGASSTTVSLSGFGAAIPGNTYFYQQWYRDTGNVGTCVPGAGFNLSNAISLTWMP